MPRLIAIIDDKEVVETGLIMFRSGNKVILYPFSDDSEYKISINVIYDLDFRGSKTNKDADSNEIYSITHTRGWNEGLASANLSSSPFASDENYDYYLYFSVLPIGTRKNFAYQFSYNILREPLL